MSHAACQKCELTLPAWRMTQQLAVLSPTQLWLCDECLLDLMQHLVLGDEAPRQLAIKVVRL